MHTSWFFLGKLGLNDENRVFFATQFMEHIFDALHNGTYPLNLRTFSNTNDRDTVEEFWHKTFYTVFIYKCLLYHIQTYIDKNKNVKVTQNLDKLKRLHERQLMLDTPEVLVQLQNDYPKQRTWEHFRLA